MSMFVRTLDILAIKPVIKKSRGKIITHSPFRMSLLTLFFYRKTIIFNLIRKRVEIYKTTFWIVTTTTHIAFDDIELFDSRVGTLPQQWGYRTGRQDQYEWINMFLHKKLDVDTVHLWTFFGEGSVKTGGTGVFLGGDSLFDFRGNQFEEFYKFQKLIGDITGIRCR